MIAGCYNALSRRGGSRNPNVCDRRKLSVKDRMLDRIMLIRRGYARQDRVIGETLGFRIRVHWHWTHDGLVLKDPLGLKSDGWAFSYSRADYRPSILASIRTL